MNLPGEELVKMGILQLDTGRPLLEEELSLRAKNLPWLQNKDIDHLPGPIALEYVGFRDVMLEGNIEGACWKITNLLQVITCYLLAGYLGDAEIYELRDHKNRYIVNSPRNKMNIISQGALTHFRGMRYCNRLFSVINGIQLEFPQKIRC